MLRAEGVTFGFGAGDPVLRSVTADLHPAALTAIVGPNGAGKSTLVRVLLGVATPRAGRVTLDGLDIALLRERERADRLAYVPQRTTVALPFSARQVVAMGLLRPDDRAAAEALELVELAGEAERPFSALSVGQQQRASLARAIAQVRTMPRRAAETGNHEGGRYLLVDEPISALDPRHALIAMHALRTLASEGVGVVAVLHDLAAAERFGDRALVMQAGSVVTAGTVRETLTPAALSGIYGVRFGSVGSTVHPSPWQATLP